MKINDLYEDDESIKAFISKGMRGKGKLFLKKAKMLPSTVSHKIDIEGTISTITDIIGDTWDTDQENLYKMLRRVIISNNIGVLIGRAPNDTSDFSDSEIVRLKIWYMAHKDLATEETATKSLWASILFAFLNGLGVALGVRKVITNLGMIGIAQTAATLQQFIYHLNTLFKKIYNGKNLKNAIRLIDTAIAKYKSNQRMMSNDHE